MGYLYTLIRSMAQGLINTLSIFTITLILSIPLGVFLSLMQTSKLKVLDKICKFYILIMRGTPLLLQLTFIFFGLPLVGITFNRYTAAIIAFVLNYGAYFGEIFRGGIESIDKGQFEAAYVLGLSFRRRFKRIILPQVIKVVLPSVANEVITLVKDTSLVYVVGIDELLRIGKIASNREASLVPLIVVGIFYLIFTLLLTKIFYILEKRYSYYL
ncbi:amino acid ABC transporter permease [Clostridium sp. MSJ-4]|uniref:Amino acid ABC transporter permease n=1 Tax=Clostridium simiarum TaxID=2841506 RepID=A0ABS6EVW3_9CLOT|nr:amino acid ABC transporter permease [Clostridium simiarum]MBU5590371.1 amino acid ABC transporter permease [Clostridium simiarum]